MLKNRSRLLVALLSAVSVLYGGLYWLQRAHFERRDFSTIKDFAARVGYCMASSLAPNEKITIAESLARPPDRALFAAVMPHALSGDITPEKLSANRALLERDELRARTFRTLSNVAERCGYNDPRNTVEYSLEDLALQWLEHDPAFVAILAEVRQRPPDAAVRFKEAVQQAGQKGRVAGTSPEESLPVVRHAGHP